MLFCGVSLANPLSLLFGPPSSRGKLTGDYQSDTFHENEKKQSQSERVIQKDSELVFKFYQSDDTDMFILGNFHENDLGRETLIVGKNNTSVGGQLQSISGGLGFKTSFFNNSILMMSAEYGSASDEPFGEARNTSVLANLAYAFPPSEHSQWIFFLNYSNNRSFLNGIPLPAFAWMYRPSKSFSVTIGVPFFSWNDFDFPRRTLRIFIGPWGAGYDIAFGLLGPLQIFHKFQYRIETYLHDNRLDDDDRFFFENKTAEIGLRSPLARWLSLEASTGFAFDRFYYEGEGLFDQKGDRTRTENDYFVRTKMTLRF